MQNLLSLDLHQSLWRRLLTLCRFAPSVKTTYAKQLGMDEGLPQNVPMLSSRDRIADTNILSMLDLMEECNMLPHIITRMWTFNILSNTAATPEQTHDLLNFREIGQLEFEAHVNYRILRTPSADAPRRRKRLQTFTNTKATQKRLKQIDRERKIQQTCMKKQLVVLANGQQMPPECEFTFIPDQMNYLQKVTRVKQLIFETRYKKVSVIVSNFQTSWVPESVILEGMFLIQTAPPPGVTTFQQYTEMLLKRLVLPHLRAGTLEVHLVFDDPDQAESPKEIELQLREKSASIDSDHTCITMQPLANAPKVWRSKLLNCRICKRALCNFLSNNMLIQSPKLLSGNKAFITAGGFDVE